MRSPEADRSTRVRLAATALAGLVLCLGLGAFVRSRPPTGLDRFGATLRGENVPLATVLTALGYWPTLTVLGIAAIAASYAARRNAWDVGAVIAAHALSQAALAGVKLLVERPRPPYWLVRHEIDSSFPSGHASTSMTFYLALAIVLGRTLRPRTVAVAIAALLAACAAGIPWSRLALGAHYLTDVAGGLLFGLAWVALTLSIVPRLGRARRTAGAGAGGTV